MNDNYVVEFAKGHFVSKGVVPMSTYILDFQKQIVYMNEIHQFEYIGIIEGCTIEYGCSDENENTLVSLPKSELVKIIDTFDDIVSEDGVTVEFGVLYDGIEYEPYLIDCVKEISNNEAVNLDSIQNGVISEGKTKGKLVMLDIGNISDSLDAHFYNSIQVDEKQIADSVIFYSELPSIKFLELLNYYEPSKIGFVFKRGSLLCHLSVLLREKGIPAIVGINGADLKIGEEYTLDTSRENKLETVCK